MLLSTQLQQQILWLYFWQSLGNKKIKKRKRKKLRLSETSLEWGSKRERSLSQKAHVRRKYRGIRSIIFVRPTWVQKVAVFSADGFLLAALFIHTQLYYNCPVEQVCRMVTNFPLPLWCLCLYFTLGLLVLLSSGTPICILHPWLSLPDGDNVRQRDAGCSGQHQRGGRPCRDAMSW